LSPHYRERIARKPIERQDLSAKISRRFVVKYSGEF
jgi:hypothetical protein